MAIADKEGIQVDEIEVETTVQQAIAAVHNPTERARLMENREFRQRVAQELRLERALQKLLRIVQNTEQQGA